MERKPTGTRKVIAFQVSEPTFQALTRLKRRHAGSWLELALWGIVKAFGGASEEDAADCRQVEAELRGRTTLVQADPSGGLTVPAKTVAKGAEPAEAPPPPASNEEPGRLVAAVVTCLGCQGRMTRGTMVVKRDAGYYHPQCLPVA